MATKIITHSLGYPRIGAQRELKAATESFWKGQTTRDALEATGQTLRAAHWQAQAGAGIDWVPVNDFSFYDQVLDTACLFGAIPARFGWKGGAVDLETRFRLARGVEAVHAHGDECGCGHTPATALEMTKWFDTNYHYLVPEFEPGLVFRLSSDKPVAEFREARALGVAAKPVLLGPVTFLSLGKGNDGVVPLALLDQLLPLYIAVLRQLAEAGATWVQIDEPILALDLNEAQRAALHAAYTRIAAEVPQVRVLLATYFGELRENLPLALGLPTAALHLDGVRGAAELEAAATRLPEGKILSVGIVDGRNIWRNDFADSLAKLRPVLAQLGAERLWLAPSCSLLHVPVSLRAEGKLDPELRGWLAFAEEKLLEVRLLADALSGTPDAAALAANAAAQAARKGSARIHRPEVAARLAGIAPGDYDRASAFPERRKRQQVRLNLPAFPTTTIGSFPQTAEVRAARAKWKQGTLSEADYDAFLAAEITDAVRRQEELGLDLLVHGEFERNDMVEYFGERLDGYAFTANGWVQSYGSRCVKPPIIFGDVRRPAPMTVRWSQYAQGLTPKPMKGMLTGPITMLQWSFVRDDQPRRTTATQLALALRDEVTDLEAAGLAAIQIDEPAVREGLPLRRGDWAAYLGWAVDLFRLSAAGVRDETQIHTHMCYCEFNDIIDAIARLDADVISIETSRSRMELLGAFANFNYPNEIGPGVWDIHSPRVPSADEMEGLLRKAVAVLPRENLWANPDCGLKTRAWTEVVPALRNLVEAARRLRKE